MTGTIVCVVVLVLILAFVEARASLRRAALRKDMSERMDRVIGPPMRRPPLEMMEIPKHCPCCGRVMSGPVGMATETTLRGTRNIPICSVCLSMGPIDSIMATAHEVAMAPPSS